MNVEVQSASLDVPAPCPNKCPFCISKIHKGSKMLENKFIKNESGTYKGYYSAYIEQEFKKRLEFLRDKKIDTIVFTGTSSEPIFNMDYIDLFYIINLRLPSPFKIIELQTSGIGLDKDTLERLKRVGFTTIAISLASFDSETNINICSIQPKYNFYIKTLCQSIKKHGFNLRLCLNINKIGFSKLSKRMLFECCKDLEADQITFRKLYKSRLSGQSTWIENQKMSETWWYDLHEYIQHKGKELYKLPFGAMKHSIHGMSTVIDSDCMGKRNNDGIKHLILRRNCKLYSQWDDPASLVF